MCENIIVNYLHIITVIIITFIPNIIIIIIRTESISVMRWMICWKCRCWSYTNPKGHYVYQNNHHHFFRWMILSNIQTIHLNCRCFSVGNHSLYAWSQTMKMNGIKITVKININNSVWILMPIDRTSSYYILTFENQCMLHSTIQPRCLRWCFDLFAFQFGVH